MEYQNLTDKQNSGLHIHMTVTQMVIAYQQKYGDDSFTVSKDFGFAWGKGLGNVMKGRKNITGTDASAIAELLNASLEEVGLWDMNLSPFKADGNEAVAVNDSFCALMSGTRAFQVIQVPHDKICPNYSWPILKGIVSAINPEAKHEVRESRAFGANQCQHVFVVPS